MRPVRWTSHDQPQIDALRGQIGEEPRSRGSASPRQHVSAPTPSPFATAVKAAAWAAILPLLASGAVKPIVERTYKLEEAAEALRHLIEDRPFGRVVVAEQKA